MAKEIISVTQEADHFGNVASITDARYVKKREVWKYSFEFNGMLKAGKVYRITVEELD